MPEARNFNKMNTKISISDDIEIHNELPLAASTVKN